MTAYVELYEYHELLKKSLQIDRIESLLKCVQFPLYETFNELEVMTIKYLKENEYHILWENRGRGFTAIIRQTEVIRQHEILLSKLHRGGHIRLTKTLVFMNKEGDLVK